MYRKKSTWIVFFILFIISSYSAYLIFPNAFAILNIDLKMSRQQALSKALEISNNYNIGPSEASQVVTFTSDNNAQNFIELDQGGSEKFIEILDNNYYDAYYWHVRHYQPGNVNESWIRFTPEGDVYGFYERLSDDLFLESLDEGEALIFAQNEASEKWDVDFEKYILAEKSQDKKPSNRIDYNFVYKRSDISLGEEGEYRLKLTVSGSKLTSVERFIKIPESFKMKYEEMRSANNTIATIANYGILIFYVLGGIVLGLFLLNRERWLIWKQAIYWALFISILMFFSGVNFFPLSWLNYDTALSTNNFILQNFLFSLINTVIFSVVLILSFLAAEGLSRKAFPEHIQFWKLWHKENAASTQVLGQTIGGYLIIGIDLIFVAVFYTVTSHYLGWWTPSGPLFSPDMIATPFPWLSAIGMSLQAGFWEECLFRAVPLAGAALIGQKYGNKKLWIGFAMILQALIFAAAHANYPSYPAYSRLVELIVPSFIFGFIYLKFGLLPAIIAHFGYDVVWFSLPIFVSSSNDVIFDKIMVLLLALVPLWVVLKSYLKTGKMTELSEEFYNKSFKPIKINKEQTIKKESDNLSIYKNYKPLLYVLFVIGLILIFTIPNKRNINLNLEINRSEAIKLAKDYMSEYNINLNNDWVMLTALNTGTIDIDDDYVWENEGGEYYKNLLGSYVSNNNWIVRYVKFDGDVSERSEEYRIILNHDGSLNQIMHKYPENAEGLRINESDARVIAMEFVENRFLLKNVEIEEISASPSNLVNRDDWFFIFKDTFNSTADTELRIKISISGDEIVSFDRYVHIPEKWQRDYKDDKTFLSIVNLVSYFLMMFFVVYAAAFSLSKWSKGAFNFSVFKTVSIVLLFLGFLDLFNSYPQITSSFSTGSPFMNQIITGIGGSVVMLVLGSLLLASIIGNITKVPKKSIYVFSNLEVILLSVGILGLIKFSKNIEMVSPYWISDQGFTNTYFPLITHLNDSIYQFFSNSILLMFVFTFINNLTDYGRKRQWLYILILFMFTLSMNGMAIGNNLGVSNFSQLLYISIVVSVIFIFMYKFYVVYDITIIPIIISIMLSMQFLLISTTNSYPSVLIGNVIPAVLVLFAGYVFRTFLINYSK